MAQNFSENIIIYDKLGQTIEKRSIFYIGITNNRTLKSGNNTPCMLFTGLHHAREPISLTMNLYIITKTLFDFFHGVNNIKEVLSSSILIFIPAINIDGYNEIIDIYEKTIVLTQSIRKNRRKFTECDKFLSLFIELNIKF